MNTSPLPVFKTRVGKIARLPRALRSALNERLADGEPAGPLLAWLNGLPEVQAVLAGQFGGRPINEQNLSDWRQGGFAEWLRHEEDCAWLSTRAEERDELEEAGDASLTNTLESLVLLELTRMLRAAQALPEGPEKCRLVFGVADRLCQLRRTTLLEARQSLAEEEQEAAERAAMEAKLAAAEEKLRKQLSYLRTMVQTLRVVAAEKEAARGKGKPGAPIPEAVQADLLEAKLRELHVNSSRFKVNQGWAEPAPEPSTPAEDTRTN